MTFTKEGPVRKNKPPITGYVIRSRLAHIQLLCFSRRLQPYITHGRSLEIPHRKERRYQAKQEFHEGRVNGSKNSP